MYAREQRMTVNLEARMRLDLGWAVVWVHNLSKHGMMLWSSVPPRPGSYVEVKRARTTIIARAVWVRDKFFGLRTEEALDISTLLGGAARPASIVPARSTISAPATRDSHQPNERIDRSRFLDFALVAIIVSLGALVAAMPFYDALGHLLHPVASHLIGGP